MDVQPGGDQSESVPAASSPPTESLPGDRPPLGTPASRPAYARRALHVALSYAVLAALWIVLSDRLLASLVPDPAANHALQTIKGWLFVLVTAALLFLLMRGELASQRTAAIDLSQTRGRLSAVLETIPEGIAVVDRNGDLLFTNPAARRMLRLEDPLAPQGQETSARTGRFPGDCLPLERILRTGETVRGLEFSTPGPGGAGIVVSLNAAPLRDETGQSIGVVASLTDITHSKPMEAALRESEERFRALVQYAFDVILVVDAQGLITYTTPAAERILGVTAEQLIGMDVADLVYPEDRARARQELAFVHSSSGLASPSVFRAVRGDGEVIYLEVVGSNLLEHPRVGGILITARDVSERMRSEDEIARHAREMEALYETSLEITSQHGLTDLLKAIVERAARLLGARTGGLYLLNPDGVSLRLAVSHDLPGDPVGTIIRFGEGLSGRVAQMGKPMMVEDYSQWVGRAHVYDSLPFRRVLAVPLKRGGRLIGVIDITDDQKTGLFSDDEVRLVSLFADQAAIVIENARLLEETQRRAAYLEAVTAIATALRSARTRNEMPPILLDRLTRLVDATAAALLLWEPETRRVTTLLALGAWERYPAPDFSNPRDPIARSLQDGQTVVTDNAYALLGLPQPHEPQGARSVIVAPLVTEEQVIGALSVGRDPAFSGDDVRLVSAVAEMAGNAFHRAGIMDTLEQRVAERTQALADANLRLQELDRLKSEFVSNVSHELRTPITNIMLYLDLLASTPTDERRVRYLETLTNEAFRLGRLIEDLLTLSRIERGVLPVDREAHALDPLLSEIVAAHMAKAASKGIRLTHETNDDLPVVSINRERIAQVFNNLLANSLAYGQRDGEARVSSRLAEVDGRQFVAVAVFNDGPPIDPTDLPHVFERFYRGQAARASGEHGTGLGLAISQEIVGLHHGWIEVSSNQSQGTTFTVWLPAAS